MAKSAGKRVTVKGTATAGQRSGRVVKGADRKSKSSAAAGKKYSSTKLGKMC